MIGLPTCTAYQHALVAAVISPLRAVWTRPLTTPDARGQKVAMSGIAITTPQVASLLRAHVGARQLPSVKAYTTSVVAGGARKLLVSSGIFANSRLKGCKLGGSGIHPCAEMHGIICATSVACVSDTVRHGVKAAHSQCL